MHFLKKGQKIRAWVDPLPPSFRQCLKENVFFSIDVFPYHHLKCLPSCVCKGNIWQKFGGGGIITPIFDALLL